MASNYEWNIDKPPILKDHSLVKHDLLQSYIEQYVRVLTSNVRQEILRLTIVDGFCGGGRYTLKNGDLRPGSPVILLRAIKSAEAQINLEREKPLKILAEFHFADDDPMAMGMLRRILADEGFGSEIDTSIFLHPVEFGNVAPSLLRNICEKYPRTQRAIFVLDQYAYSDVPFRLLKEIFGSLSHPEVILTFGKDLLVNYITDSSQYRNILDGLGLPQEEIEYLSGVRLEGSLWKQSAEMVLSKSLLKGSGAKFFTPFFIKSNESHRAYWLVHLSNHVKARNVMTDLHWSSQNSFQHFGGAGLNMLGFDSAKTAIEDQFTFEFSQPDQLLVKSALQHDLPYKIENFKDGIRFDQLIPEIANETPSTDHQIEEALVGLRDEGDLDILNSEGRKRERAIHLDNEDVLRIAKQGRFIF